MICTETYRGLAGLHLMLDIDENINTMQLAQQNPFFYKYASQRSSEDYDLLKCYPAVLKESSVTTGRLSALSLHSLLSQRSYNNSMKSTNEIANHAELLSSGGKNDRNIWTKTK